MNEMKQKIWFLIRGSKFYSKQNKQKQEEEEDKKPGTVIAIFYCFVEILFALQNYVHFLLDKRFPCATWNVNYQTQIKKIWREPKKCKERNEIEKKNVLCLIAVWFAISIWVWCALEEKRSPKGNDRNVANT